MQLSKTWQGRTGGKLRWLLALLMLAALLPLAAPARAGGVIVVNDMVDHATSPFAAAFENGKCSLREAIQAANFDTAVNTTGGADCPAGNGHDVITFSGGGTISLKSDSPADDIGGIFINTEITINGPIIINGQNKARIFRISGNGNLTLAHVTLQNGFTTGSGAAIFNQQGQLNTIDVSFVNNKAENTGGAIDSNGTLNLLMTNFAGNTAGNDGGAIWSSGYGTNKIAVTNISGNIAGNKGGALYNNSRMLVEDTIFSGNIVTTTLDSEGGGALFHNGGGELHVLRSAFNANLSPFGGSGGALYNNINATALITDSSFNGNISGDLSNAGRGGAVYNMEELSLVRVAFNANLSNSGGNGGALVNNKVGNVLIANSSFFANQANGDGGAIYNYDSPNPSGSESTVTIKSSTIWGNGAQSEGGAIYNAVGERVRVQNTIIAGSLSGGNCTGTITSDGHNIDSANTCNLLENGDGDMINEDPLLDKPFYNGGAIASLLTLALKDGSPAIDAGNNTACAAAPVSNKDQRGEKRPNNGDGIGDARCDIGAIERDTAMPGYGSTPASPGSIEFGTSQMGQAAITKTLSIFETGNLPLTVISMTLIGSHPGDFQILSPSSFTILDGGAARTVVLACQAQGTGVRNAKLVVGHDAPKPPLAYYDLTCNGIAAAVPPASGFSSTPPSPGPINLGSANIGTTRTANIKVEESGNATLTVGLAATPLTGPNAAEFAVVTNMAGFSIANGAPAKNIQVSCTPTTAGIRQATLNLTSNDSFNATISFTLTCNGTVPPAPLLEQTDANDDDDTNPFVNRLGGPVGVAASPDGRHVYVASTLEDAVSSFEAWENGALVIVDVDEQGAGGVTRLDAPYNLTVSPDGKNVYVASFSGDALVVFDRNPGNGNLTFNQSIPADGLTFLDGAYDVEVSPDGKYVYATGGNDNGYNVFKRDLLNGKLTRVQSTMGGSGSLTDFVGPRGLAISPDGNHVYITSSVNDALYVFKRSPTSGLLTYVEYLKQGVAGVDGLDGAYDAVVSPDGAHVYVASIFGDAVVAFNRDLATGKLSYVNRITNNLFFGALDGAYGLTTSADGEYIYVASSGAGSLTVLTWDDIDARLEVVTWYYDDQNGVTGLGGARMVAANPKRDQIYVTGYTDNAVTVFSGANPAPMASSLSPGSVTAGSAGIDMEINGSNFISNSTVRWNGSARPTTYVNSTQLVAKIPAADLAAATSAQITVFNPGPGGGLSNALSFKVLAPNLNPVPVIEKITPGSIEAGSASFTLVVQGINFINGAKIRWNGADLATAFVNGGRLQASISADKLAAEGLAAVTVFNPAPGGGLSNAMSFSIVKTGSNLIPAIDSLSTSILIARGAKAKSLVVKIIGANFMPETVARWDGQDRQTSFINSTTLEMTLTAADLAFVGKSSISVFTPTPGGGTSNTMTFVKAYGTYMPLAAGG